jgi:hypothetical protein
MGIMVLGMEVKVDQVGTILPAWGGNGLDISMAARIGLT